MTPWWVVVNPSAGRGVDNEARIRAVLTRRGIDHVVHVSGSPDEVPEIIESGRSAGSHRFVAVGGDGTTNLVVNGMLASEWPTPPTLAVVPGGSASDFVRTFGIPGDMEQASAHLQGEGTIPLDVGLLTGSFGRRYFVNAANAGIAARTVVESARLSDRLGHRRYIVAFWAALAKTNPADVSVDIDGAVFERLAWNVVIANGRYFGGAMHVAPEAVADDGVFDVQVFSGHRRNAPNVIRRVMRGTHLTHRAVHRTTGTRITVAVPDKWMVEADGEIVGTGPFTAQALRGKVLLKV